MQKIKGKTFYKFKLNRLVMYKLNYYNKLTTGLASKEQNFEYVGSGETFKLRRDALHYLFDTVKNDYEAMDYTTEIRVGGLYCKKSGKTAEGDRKIMEILIKIEK